MEIDENDEHDDTNNGCYEDFNEATIAEHLLFGMKSKKDNFNHTEALQQCKNYLNEITTQTRQCVNNLDPTKCTCLSFIETEAEDSEIMKIARYMI
eukprot:11267846-Ditylum_brightwellii.AAC.1